MILEVGRRYCATLRLGFFESVASNSTIVKKLVEWINLLSMQLLQVKKLLMMLE